MLSDEQIEKITGASRARAPVWLVASAIARAIEAEVRKDDESLIRQMLEHLEVVTDAGPDGDGWQSQDLKNTIAAAHSRLEKAP